VEVVTRRGTLAMPVWLNGRGRPPEGTIFVPFFDERLLINIATLGDICPISKEPDFKKCAATVRKRVVQPGARTTVATPGPESAPPDTSRS